MLESCPAFGTELKGNRVPQLEEDSFEQITSVSQLKDVSSTHWAFEALRNPVERCSCIAGYPNGTFRGNRTPSRYEFAAGLNFCIQAIERLMAKGDKLFQEEIEKLNRLTSEFPSELGARVDKLEGPVAFLENKQFSTTTKLRGNAPYNNASSFPGVKKSNTGVAQDRAVFSYRAPLNFDASFMGKDLLRVRIQGSNSRPLDANSDMVRLSHDTTTGFDNNVNIDNLYYPFPIGDSITAFVGTNAMNIDKVFNVNNLYLESDATGTLVNLLRRNPLSAARKELVVALKSNWENNGI
ncbi:MAG: iron uptake porin [Geminocystis sp.]|nr:iron uptake porin [Geminocystis sp.]MDW8115060.1 iron uptake porin [Geminocystis sp.]